MLLLSQQTTSRRRFKCPSSSNNLSYCKTFPFNQSHPSDFYFTILFSSFTSRAQFDPLVNLKSHRGRRFPLLWRFVQNPQNTHCKLQSVFFFLSRRSETTAVSAPFYTSGHIKYYNVMSINSK